ncbi:MAG TPA: hypothetical protein VF457_18430, partial [Burkholderiaceae bacterium]
MTAPARQQAIHACDFWTGLEYMNLVAVPDPDEKRHVFRIDADADLPWVHPGRTRSLAERARRYKAQVAYCGLFGKGAYTAALRADLGAGALPVRDLPRGEAATLLLPLDDTGRVCGEPFVSSLPWLMGRLRGHLASGAPAGQLDLRGFDAFQAGLLVELRQLLVRLQLVPEEELRAREPQGREDDAAAARPRADKVCGSPDMNPLAMRDVRELLSLVWTRCGWNPPGWCEAEAAGDDLHLVRIKVVPMTRHVDRAVDLGALNSLVAADVMRVRARLASDAEPGPALSQYLQLHPRPQRVDLRDGAPGKGLGVFVDALAPGRLPAGAWPDFPLVAAQQFAVNAARRHLADGGLYGVNGPPGTGKSTLLRDVIADFIVGRAEAMARYDDPLAAFPCRGEIEGYKFPFWEIDAPLQGLGIVVASSNNGAVENVIKDLPRCTAPMREAGIDYFAEVSDSVAAARKARRRDGGATWGLVAALLGSADKRRAFVERFWFEPPPADADAPDAQPLRSLRGIMERQEHGAMPWAQATAAFQAACRL